MLNCGHVRVCVQLSTANHEIYNKIEHIELHVRILIIILEILSFKETQTLTYLIIYVYKICDGGKLEQFCIILFSQHIGLLRPHYAMFVLFITDAIAVQHCILSR